MAKYLTIPVTILHRQNISSVALKTIKNLLHAANICMDKVVVKFVGMKRQHADVVSDKTYIHTTKRHNKLIKLLISYNSLNKWIIVLISHQTN